MTDLFDSISSFIGVSQATGLVDERRPAAAAARGPDRRLVRDARRRAARHLVGHRLRGEHRRHPHGRPHRPHGRRHGAVLPAVPVHRAAGRRGAGLRHVRRAHRGRRVDVPGGDAGRAGSGSRRRCRPTWPWCSSRSPSRSRRACCGASCCTRRCMALAGRGREVRPMLWGLAVLAAALLGAGAHPALRNGAQRAALRLRGTEPEGAGAQAKAPRASSRQRMFMPSNSAASAAARWSADAFSEGRRTAR